MTIANSQIAREVSRVVGCRVSSVSQRRLPGRAMRCSTWRAKPLMARAITRMLSATASPGKASSMPLMR